MVRHHRGKALPFSFIGQPPPPRGVRGSTPSHRNHRRPLACQLHGVAPLSLTSHRATPSFRRAARRRPVRTRDLPSPTSRFVVRLLAVQDLACRSRAPPPLRPIQEVEAQEGRCNGQEEDEEEPADSILPLPGGPPYGPLPRMLMTRKRILPLPLLAGMPGEEISMLLQSRAYDSAVRECHTADDQEMMLALSR